MGTEIKVEMLVGGFPLSFASIGKGFHIVTERKEIQQGLTEIAMDLLEGAEWTVDRLDE